MADKGSFIGYDPAGNPVAVAVYGPPPLDSWESARRFCSTGNLKARHFRAGDPDLDRELDRWKRFTLNIEEQADGP